MSSLLPDYLEDFFFSWRVKLASVIYPRRTYLKLQGTAVTSVTDDEANDQIVVQLDAGAVGTVNLATDVTGVLPVGHGGTGTNILSDGILHVATGVITGSPIVDADIDPAAAIDPSKIATAPSVDVTADLPNIDWSLGTVLFATLGAGANAITFSNDTDGQTIVVELTGAASTVSWPASVKWAGGAAPTQTASGVDVYTFVKRGTSVHGAVLQAMA